MPSQLFIIQRLSRFGACLRKYLEKGRLKIGELRFELATGIRIFSEHKKRLRKPLCTTLVTIMILFV